MRVSSALLLSAALALTSSCVSVARPPVAPIITLEPDARPGHWRAAWTFASPTRELRFERDSDFRRGLFEVITPGFTAGRDGEIERLRTDGAPVNRIEVRFPEFTRELEKDYDFFQKFTDGSVAIYTGHLTARAAGDCETCFVRTFRFVPPAGAAVIAGGARAFGPVEWTDTAAQGAYVYFGRIVPIETREMISIVDPGLPPWVQEDVGRLLPQLFEMYTKRLGAGLASRPLVMFNFADNGGAGHSWGGGVLPGQIQLRLDGAAWKERSNDALISLFQFLAHESAHLWNGQVIRYDGREDAWMHEGSADALAQRTLLALGIIDQREYLDRQSLALNECVKGTGAWPLRDAAKHRAFQLYYSCGNALSLYTERVTGGDLHAFWNELIARVRNSGRIRFDAADYLATMTAKGASEENVTTLRKFVEQEAAPDQIDAMLRSAGVTLREVAPPETFARNIAREALFHLLSEHCRGGYGFTTTDAGLTLSERNDCGPLPAAMTVTHIGSHDVFTAGAAAWDALHERCGSGEPVRITLTLEGTSRELDVPCGKPVLPRRPYLEIE